MKTRSRFIIASAAVVAVAHLLAAPGLAQRSAEPKKDPAEWRDSRRAELREQWDKLEGKPVASLAPLENWINVPANARSWEGLRGKVVLVDFWATWCGPCVATIPKLTEMHEKYHKDGLVILAVHSANGWERMADFVAQRQLPFAFAADTNRKLGEALGVRFLPTFFLVDRDGIMRVAGADRNRLEEMAKTVLAEPWRGTTPRGSEPATEEATAAGPWPAHVEKNLYADDFRGKKAPELQVERWLSRRPNTNGKVVLIDFWATWCGPCRAAIPKLNEYQEKFADDLAVIGISDEPIATVRNFMRDNEMNFPQAVDTQARMKNALGVKGIPHVIVMSTDGVVRWQGFPGSPEDPLTAEVIKQIIDADPGVAQRRARERQRERRRGG